MKLVPFALLLCAGAVMAANVVTQCTGIAKNRCPAGYHKEYHGRTMNNSACYCVRPETDEEAEKRETQEKPARCRQAKTHCLRSDSSQSNSARKSNSCDSVLHLCERDDINQFCDTLKRNKTRWQCEAANGYKQLTFEETEQKICHNLEDQCLQSGRYYPNSDPNSQSCEDYVRKCSRGSVLTFCSHQRGRRSVWSCNESKAYDDRFNHHDLSSTVGGDPDIEAKRKVCDKAHDQCYSTGRYYPNSDPLSESCEDLVRSCSASSVNIFCSNIQSSRRFKWRCANSKAYKARRDSDLNPFDWSNVEDFQNSL